MTGRNAPCPCGSGKKYKRCCAGEADAAAAAAGSAAASPAANSAASGAEPPAAQLQQLVSLANAADFERLEQRATALARAFPASGVVLKLLALALWQQRKDPLAALERAVRCLPNDAEAASNLGNAQRSAGQLENAVASQRRALVLAPGYAAAHNNLGGALQDLGRREEAARSFRRAAELDPAFALAHVNLGNVLLELGRPEQALSSYENALRAQPDHLGALLPMGAIFRDTGNLEAAERAFRRATVLNPSAAELRYNLAVVLRLQNRGDDAAAACQQALDLNPKLVPALVLLAKLHVDRGEFGAAQALLERAVSIDPDSAEAWSMFPALRRMTLHDAPWLHAAQRIAAGPLPARQEAHLRFALGKYFDDLGEFGPAFAEYRRANELVKTFAAAHDGARMAKFVELILETNFSVPAAPERAASDQPGLRDGARPQIPVFIIGMPRSGTSLAEQILASHARIHGAGELPFWGNALRGMLSAGTPAQAALEPLAREYRALLTRLAPHADCVVDKMPSNFLAAGLIVAALPEARIIHMQRSPIDTCLSIYFQDFESAYSYANDLSDLADAYREYLRLMRHWRATLPAGAMLEVPYEGLVQAQEPWTRRMLDFLGLPWDAACLDFHRTRRTVATVSSWQVRQTLHASSVGRWRNYQPFIAPLLPLADALSPAQ